MKTGTNWLYQGQEVKELPKDCEAFVYLITNTTNGMMYVGCLLYTSPSPRDLSTARMPSSA